MPDLNYKEDLVIDKYNLELEWAKIPLLFSKWSERLIDEENRRDRLRNQIELAYAELDSEIRSKPEEYGLSESPTERAIRSIIIMQEEYKALQEEYMIAKYNSSILRVAVRRIKDKEKAIDRLTKLHLASYYIEPYHKKNNDEDCSDGAQATLNASMKAKRMFRR